jgi:hypothetical protein
MNNLILITSVICTQNTPLSYTNTRSVYSHKERFEQTKKTISTIKEKIPNAKIFIVECSNLDVEQLDYLIKNSDYFLNLYNNEQIRNNTSHISKSLGEGTMTLCALKFIIQNNIEFENLIKISGRYWLSEKFEYKNFNNNDIVVKYIENNKDNAFTALYKLPKSSCVNFMFFLESRFNDMINCVGYENLFAIFIKTENKQLKILEPIGLAGYVSVSNDFYSG